MMNPHLQKALERGTTEVIGSIGDYDLSKTWCDEGLQHRRVVYRYRDTVIVCNNQHSTQHSNIESASGSYIHDVLVYLCAKRSSFWLSEPEPWFDGVVWNRTTPLRLTDSLGRRITNCDGAIGVYFIS